MAFAGTKIYHSHKLKGATLSSPRPDAGADQVTFSSKGYAEIDPADAASVAAAAEQGAVLVDIEGTQEEVNDDAAQTATTLSAVWLDNSNTGDVVFDIREDSAAGALLAGPFTIEAQKSRIIVFPVPLVAGVGIFFNTTSGTLETINGFLIP